MTDATDTVLTRITTIRSSMNIYIRAHSRPSFWGWGITVFLSTCHAIRAIAETILITGAIIHVGDGQELKDKQLLVRDGRIEAIESVVRVRSDRVVRLEGQHLYPGLIAMANPLGLVEIESVRATLDFAEVGEYKPDVRAWIAVNPDSELIPVARANGIGYSEVAPQGGVVAGTSGLIAMDGWTTEEMVVKAPLALHLYWPSHELSPLAKGDVANPGTWKSPEEQALVRSRRIRQIDEFFSQARAVFEGGSSGILDPSFESMFPVFKGELPVAVHADETRQIRAALAWARSQKLKMILYGGRDAWRMASEIAEAKVAVVFEHVHTLPARDTDSYDVHFRAPSVLAAAGVKVAIGLGGGFEASSARNLPYVAAQAVAYGLDPKIALKAITLHPAEILGLEGQVGTIEKGKQATFFSCDGDILDIRSNPKRLWIQGREVSPGTRHTRLYEKYKNRPKAR